MRCPHCKTFVTKIPISWKCPRCGEKLPEPGKWFHFYEHIIEYLPEKGVVFWSIWFGLILIIVGIPELIFGHGFLLGYLGGSLFLSIVFIFYGGMLVDMVMKINLPIRIPYGTDFIIRERAVIRNIRKVTNTAIIIGLVYAIYWLKLRTFFLYFPSYLVVISWFLALGWAIVGLFLDVRMAEDVRFRFLMDRIGITSLKQYRKLGTLSIGVLILAAIGYHVLISLPGLWKAISDIALVGFIVHFLKEYFSWFF